MVSDVKMDNRRRVRYIALSQAVVINEMIMLTVVIK